MARYSVLVRPRPTARLARIFESDDFHETERMAVRLSSPEVWVDDAESPGTAYLVRHGMLMKYYTPLLSPDARAEIEAFYLQARSDLLASGMPAPEVDAMLPLDDRGKVPWMDYDATHSALAGARPREAEHMDSGQPNGATEGGNGAV